MFIAKLTLKIYNSNQYKNFNITKSASTTKTGPLLSLPIIDLQIVFANQFRIDYESMTNAVTRAMTLTQVGHGNQKQADVTLLSWLMFLYFPMSVLCIITPRNLVLQIRY